MGRKMSNHDHKTLAAIGRRVFQFDNIDKFVESQQHWCSDCDQVIVDTDKPETGKWFHVAGCIYGARCKLEDHENVIFAICTDCLAKD